MADKTRTTQQEESSYNVDDGSAEVQRGKFATPGFFGDSSKSSGFGSFSSAVGMAASLIGTVASLRASLVDTRNSRSKVFYLTKTEYTEIQKRAASIASGSNIPYDVVEDFLIILCSVDNIEDMTIIADGVQIEELADPSILRQPMAILAIRALDKIAYAASAVEGLVNLFKKYLTAQAKTNPTAGEDIGSIIRSLSSFLGGLGGLGGATARLNNAGADDALGHFLSELITGKRIPMNVIAKNPNLQLPSYAGKAFFGEAPTALSLVDMDQLFNKKIACFPKPSSGAGTTSFGLQNMGSMGSSIPIANFVSKMIFGNSSFTTGTKKARQIEAAVTKIRTFTGASATEKLDVRRADTAIPMMAAMSAVMSGTDGCVFSNDT